MRAIVAALALLAIASAAAQNVTFNFDGGPINTGTPLDQVSDGMTAHFSHEGSNGYALWVANVLGFTPIGFSGNALFPATINRSDLIIDFSVPIDSISMLYAPQELNTSSSCTMKLSAFLGANPVGSTTYQSQNEGNWPTDTLAFSSASPFDHVVVHYQAPPPTGGDYGVIFAVDNIVVHPVPEPATLAVVGIALVGLAGMRRRR